MNETNDIKEKMILECSCCNGYHYLELHVWDEPTKTILLAFVDHPPNLWQAIKSYWKHRERWVSEVILRPEDTKKLIEYLQKHIE